MPGQPHPGHELDAVVAAHSRPWPWAGEPGGAVVPVGLGAPDDALEQEAEDAVGPVGSRRPATAASPEPSAGIETVFGLVREVVASPGIPLDPAARAGNERRLGRPLGHVRVHTGSLAGRSADAVGAAAYTVGGHVVLGQGAPPGTADGERLLTHELVHVLQADRQPGLAAVVRRQLAGAPAAAPTFDHVWGDFQRARYGGRDREAIELSGRLATLMGNEDALRHGTDVALWLLEQGERERAGVVLARLERAWRELAKAGVRDMLLQLGTPVAGPGPRDLVDRAMAEARAGRAQEAARLFGLGYLFTQFILRALDERRGEQLGDIGERVGRLGPEPAQEDTPARLHLLAVLSMVGRPFTYLQSADLIGLLRDVLGFYPGLERDALAAGDTAAANRYAALGRALETELLRKYTVTGPAAEAITLETTRTRTAAGTPGYVLHGVQGREETVTPLPGEPTPEELRRNPAYEATLLEVTREIGAQEQFITGLFHHPEMAKEFPNLRVDMTNLEQRLRVWRAMYRAYARTSPAEGALEPLLRLMERYLQYFTRHTGYDIRDFGVSYLSTEFPVDLLGRTVRDCGVYALTVAWELYRTAAGASPPLPLRFELVSMTDHVALVVFGPDAHWVVNNDRIVGPFKGDSIQSVGKTYGATMGRGFTVAPAVTVALGSTGMGPGEFRRQAWKQFQTSAQWGLQVQRLPGDARPEAELREEVYRTYYERLREFSRGAAQLDERLDALRGAVQGAEPDQRAGALAAALPDTVRGGLRLALIFDQAGPHTQLAGHGQLVGTTFGYIYGQAKQGEHPLARLAMAIELHRRLGGQPDADAQLYLDWIHERRPAPPGGAPQPFVKPDFAKAVDDYVAAGRPLSF